MPPQVTHDAWSDLPIDDLAPLLRRRFVSGERAMLAHVYLHKG